MSDYGDHDALNSCHVLVGGLAAIQVWPRQMPLLQKERQPTCCTSSDLLGIFWGVKACPSCPSIPSHYKASASTPCRTLTWGSDNIFMITWYRLLLQCIMDLTNTCLSKTAWSYNFHQEVIVQFKEGGSSIASWNALIAAMLLDHCLALALSGNIPNIYKCPTLC